MDELRRKIVLGSPFLTVGLLAGCGGGEDAPLAAGSANSGGRVMAQSTSTVSGQTLKVGALSGASLNAIWSTSNGGAYLVPTLPSPAIQTFLSGTALSISVAEKVVLSSSVSVYRTLSLTLDNGVTPAAGSTYSASKIKNGVLRVLKRTISGTSVTEEQYRYSLNTSTSINTGTVKVSSVGPTRQVTFDGGLRQTSVKAFGLTFTSLRFDAASGQMSGAATDVGLQLSGLSTLDVLPQETVAWL